MTKATIIAEFSFYTAAERRNREADRTFKFASRDALAEFEASQRDEQYPLYRLKAWETTEHFTAYALPRA